MIGDRAHGVVGDSSRDGATNPCWVGEEGIKPAIASVVEIDIDSTIVKENEVTD